MEGEVANKADFGHHTVSVSPVRRTCDREAGTDDVETNQYSRVQVKLHLQKRAGLAHAPQSTSARSALHKPPMVVLSHGAPSVVATAEISVTESIPAHWKYVPGQ